MKIIPAAIPDLIVYTYIKYNAILRFMWKAPSS